MVPVCAMGIFHSRNALYDGDFFRFRIFLNQVIQAWHALVEWIFEILPSGIAIDRKRVGRRKKVHLAGYNRRTGTLEDL